MELALAQKFQRRQRRLETPAEFGAGHHRCDAVTTQFKLGGHATIEDIHMATVRKNCFHSNVAVGAAHDITDCQPVATVPPGDEQPLPVPMNRGNLESHLAHDCLLVLPVYRRGDTRQGD